MGVLTAYAASLLEENVQQFKEIPGTLPIDLDERLTTDVKSFLLRGIGQLLYHPTCRSKYNYSRLERARSKKRKISSDEASGPNVVTRSHEQSSENFHTNIPFGAEICMHCREYNGFDKKHPHRTRHKKLHAAAAKSHSAEYLIEWTEKLRGMTAHLDDSQLLSLLTMDVRASELY